MASRPSHWSPPCTAKGARLINDRHRYILVTGPKKSTKTVTICQKIAKHLYDVRGANVAVVVKTKKTGKVGVWWNLCQMVIEGQFQAGGRMIPWVKRPSTSSDSKQQSFGVQNAYGGTSWCHLWSLYRDEDVERIFKNTNFSLIYVCEADQFGSSSIFSAMADQLRIGADDEKQLILDCNPPEEGEEHWLYKLFIDQPTDWPKEYRDQFSVHYFDLNDNVWISEKDKLDIINRYKGDPDKEARYVWGKWVKSRVGSLFEDQFDSNIHVIGKSYIFQPRDTWDVLIPARNTALITTGWDLGSINHAVVMGCSRWRGKELVFDIIDELVSIDMEIPLSEFVKEVMGKMERWNQVLISRGASSVEYRHWSDTSAFNFKSAAEKSEAALVLKYSDGDIQLRRIQKGRDSVRTRIGMLKRMLTDRQIYVSVLCDRVIEMLKLVKDRDILTQAGRASGSGRRHVHSFDAMTYMISHEIPVSMLESLNPQTGKGYAECAY